jgi:hypothetical protein
MAVQLVQGMPISAFSHWDMIYDVRNPRADLNAMGYGYSELEQMIRVLTGYYNAINFNHAGMDKNSLPRGFVTVFGAYNDRAARDFERRMKTMLRAASNRWEVPIMLVDLDQDYECAPPLRAAWLPSCAPRLCFRVAVRAVEAWLLADAEEFAGYLRLARSAVPKYPEALDDPKRSLVDLARRSRRKEIRDGMVPRKSSGRVVGPLYNSYVIEYVEQRWRPDVAAGHAESLARAMACLERKIREAGKATNVG